MNDNKDYINTFIKRQRIISIICISFVLLSSTISAMAVSAYLYNSNEVSYNNNASGITSTNVQGAIDELYGHVTDYTSMDTRVSALEGDWSSDKSFLKIKSAGSDTGILINNSSNVNRGRILFSPSANSLYIDSHDSTGTWGKGELSIRGKPITLNATNGGTGDINLNGNVKINGKAINNCGTWTPKLYDYTTYVRDLPASTYCEFGSIVVANINTNNPNLSGINTMMQIRNLPMDEVWGGNIYIGGMTGAGSDRTFQTATYVYPRPNIKSSDITDAATAPGWFTLLIIGKKN